MRNIKTVLQVSVITYNRSDQILFTLNSVVDAISYLDVDKRKAVGVCIYNNSTKEHQLYESIFEEYAVKFKSLGCSYFEYKRTGFNILFHNNFAISVLDSKADYTWVLPDDDLSSLDSLKILLSVINTYGPSFIHGGILNKTRYDYSKVSVDNNVKKNDILDIVYKDKEKLFLDTSGIQLQEHVYKTELIVESLKKDQVTKCLDDFSPILFGLICAENSSPMIFLRESIGIFREDDPKSIWRHEWHYMALIQWPNMVNNYFQAGLIEKSNCGMAKRIYIAELKKSSWRPDILLGFNSKFTINPINLSKEYGVEYLLLLLFSPFLFIKKILTSRDARVKFFNKLFKG